VEFTSGSGNVFSHYLTLQVALHVCSGIIQILLLWGMHCSEEYLSVG